MWKLLFQSVPGSAHGRNGRPCQDSCRARLWSGAGGSVLVLACADGAGSATHADLGARFACRAAVRLVRDDLRGGRPLAEAERDIALSWYARLRRELQAEAEGGGLEPAALACTLLLAVVEERTAVFAQVGDGAIVTRAGDDYRPVFWPQNGEYANSTNFVTDPTWADCLAFERRTGAVDELALFSDGLQMLALNFAERTAHRPFFEPMFRRLRSAAPGEGLPLALRRFLNSPAVNERSDDDKTLILATRLRDAGPEGELR
jgi:hypothetical protein